MLLFITSVLWVKLLQYFVGIQRHSTIHLEAAVFLNTAFVELTAEFRWKSPTIRYRKNIKWESSLWWLLIQVIPNLLGYCEKNLMLPLQQIKGNVTKVRVIMLKTLSPCNRRVERIKGNTGGTSKDGLSGGSWMSGKKRHLFSSPGLHFWNQCLDGSGKKRIWRRHVLRAFPFRALNR